MSSNVWAQSIDTVAATVALPLSSSGAVSSLTVRAALKSGYLWLHIIGQLPQILVWFSFRAKVLPLFLRSNSNLWSFFSCINSQYDQVQYNHISVFEFLL